jgi:hypothetical protein
MVYPEDQCRQDDAEKKNQELFHCNPSFREGFAFGEKLFTN